ncbi:MAG: LON peptidase substrate-binding domain-containing protein [Kiloniellaceae bacterium]
MSRPVFEPDFADLPRILPIFPLPGVLLLPGGRMPLNIFEPRYVAMVRDAIAGARLIGMIQPREQATDVGAAKVYGTGCAGRITAFNETEDGRYLITLTGLIRFDVERELPPLSGYRRVVADYTRFRRDLETDSSRIDRMRLLEALGTYLDSAGIEGDWKAIEETADEPLVTSLAMICPFGAPEKQALLEAMTLPERVATMTAIMEMAVHEPEGHSPRH